MLLEVVHDLFFLSTAHSAMKKSHSVIFKRALRKLFSIGLNVLQVHITFLYHWTDYITLSALVKIFFHIVKSTLAKLSCNGICFNGLSAFRKLFQYRNIKIAVYHKGKSSRDRRG